MKWLSKNLVEGTKVMNLIFKHVLPKSIGETSEQDGFEVASEKSDEHNDGRPVVRLIHDRAVLIITYFDAVGAIEDGEGPKVLLHIRDERGEPEPGTTNSFFCLDSHFHSNWSATSEPKPWLLENMPDIVTAYEALPKDGDQYLGDRAAIKHLHFMRDTFLALRGK